MPVATYDLFGEPAGFSTLAADPTAYTMGVQFTVTLTAGQTATVTKTKFFSPPGAAIRPQTIALFTVTGALLAASQAATWDGAAGSGWIRAPWTVPPGLTSGVKYKMAVLQNTGANWYGAVGAYWSSGPGAGGITNGPLSAPNNASGDGGQDTFTQSAVLAYPATSFNAANYGVDLEVTVTTPAAGGGAPDRHHHRAPAGRPGQHRPGGRGGHR